MVACQLAVPGGQDGLMTADQVAVIQAVVGMAVVVRDALVALVALVVLLAWQLVAVLEESLVQVVVELKVQFCLIHL